MEKAEAKTALFWSSPPLLALWRLTDSLYVLEECGLGSPPSPHAVLLLVHVIGALVLLHLFNLGLLGILGVRAEPGQLTLIVQRVPVLTP